MSRLQTGSMEVLHQSTDVNELVDAAVDSLGPRGERWSSTSSIPSPASRPTRSSWSGLWPTSSTMRSSMPGGPGSGSKPVRWPDGSTSGSSTAGRASAPRTGTGYSARSSASGTRENQSGVGLGLAVARGFVEAVGGDLDVEDTPGGGCTMVVRIPEVDTTGRSCPSRLPDRSADVLPERRCPIGLPDEAAGLPSHHRLIGGPGAVNTRSPAPSTTRGGVESGTKVLVCDDDTSLLRALSISLTARGYEVMVARSGEEGLDRTADRHPDVVLLDLGLPGIDGVEVIRAIRGWSSVPIIVLSARHQSVSKVEALDAGADDYVTKPFGMDELLARLRAACADRPTPSRCRRSAEGCTVDLVEKRVTQDGVDVHLTPKEWDIVEVLVRNPGRLVSQRQLLHDVWGPGYEAETEYLRVLMGRVRRKLEVDHSHPRHFRTEPGMGYRFEP